MRADIQGRKFFYTRLFSFNICNKTKDCFRHSTMQSYSPITDINYSRSTVHSQSRVVLPCLISVLRIFKRLGWPIFRKD